MTNFKENNFLGLVLSNYSLEETATWENKEIFQLQQLSYRLARVL